MNVRRGLFRIWVVVAVLWIGAMAGWLVVEHRDDRRDAINAVCNLPLEEETRDQVTVEEVERRLKALDEYDKCAAKYKAEHSLGSWFWRDFKKAWWIVMFVPPLALLAGAVVVFMVGRWIGRGFKAGRRRP